MLKAHRSGRAPSEHHNYDGLRALLPARFRSITLDWPAHGASPPPSRPATAMLFADVAEEPVATLASQGAVVMAEDPR